MCLARSPEDLSGRRPAASCTGPRMAGCFGGEELARQLLGGAVQCSALQCLWTSTSHPPPPPLLLLPPRLFLHSIPSSFTHSAFASTIHFLGQYRLVFSRQFLTGLDDRYIYTPRHAPSPTLHSTPSPPSPPPPLRLASRDMTPNRQLRNLSNQIFRRYGSSNLTLPFQHPPRFLITIHIRCRRQIQHWFCLSTTPLGRWRRVLDLGVWGCEDRFDYIPVEISRHAPFALCVYTLDPIPWTTWKQDLRFVPDVADLES